MLCRVEDGEIHHVMELVEEKDVVVTVDSEEMLDKWDVLSKQ